MRADTSVNTNPSDILSIACDAMRKYRLAKWWLADGRRRIPVQEVFRCIIAEPVERRAKKLIETVRTDGEYIEIRLKGVEGSLFYPRSYNITGLSKTITEILIKSDPHFYEKPVTQVMQGDIVLDCGAAEGLFALTVCNRCKKVYCFEPLASFTQSLRKTFAPMDNVIVEQLALADFKGKAYLSGSQEGSVISAQVSGEGCEVSTIDSLFYDKGEDVDYIKIDVEGSEASLIKGASNTIRSRKPRIAAAAYHYPKQAVDIAETIMSIDPHYSILMVGFDYWTKNVGSTIMVHAWVDQK